MIARSEGAVGGPGILSSEDGDEVRALRAIGMGTWRWNLANGTVAWSEPTYRLFGIDHRTHVASLATFLAVVHPADRADVESKLARAARSGVSGTVTVLEFRFLRADGALRWCSCASTLVALEGGVLEMLGVVSDITERHVSLAALADTAAFPLEPPTFSSRDAAQLLGLSEATIKRFANAGTLGCLRSDARGARRFNAEHLLAWLRHGAPPASAPATLEHATGPFARAANRGDAAEATAIALYASGVGLDRILDTLFAPVAADASDAFLASFLQRAAGLGPRDNKKSGNSRAQAIVAPLGHPVPVAAAMIDAFLRASGYDVLRPAEGLGALHLAHLALRSRARLVAFVLPSGVTPEDARANQALEAAHALTSAFRQAAVCIHGLSPGAGAPIVEVRTMASLAALLQDEPGRVG